MGERIELMMDSKTRKWLVDYTRRNYWRVANWMDFEDLVQDGFVTFHMVRQRYRGTRKNHQHLLNTFKLSFRNHLHRLANERTRAVVQLQILDADPDIVDEDYITPLERLSPREPESQPFTAALQQAPYRIKEALAVFSSDEGRASLRRPYRRRGDGSRETLNDRLCRIAGFDSDCVDLVTPLRAYLTTD